MRKIGKKIIKSFILINLFVCNHVLGHETNSDWFTQTLYGGQFINQKSSKPPIVDNSVKLLETLRWLAPIPILIGLSVYLWKGKSSSKKKIITTLIVLILIGLFILGANFLIDYFNQ